MFTGDERKLGFFEFDRVAHCWVRERLQQIRDELPFPLLGVDSDSGGEFIKAQVKDWCDQNHIQFTRAVPTGKTTIACGPLVRFLRGIYYPGLIGMSKLNRVIFSDSIKKYRNYSGVAMGSVNYPVSRAAYKMTPAELFNNFNY
jgi:hypothetical protein